jgi:hypothetical protein
LWKPALTSLLAAVVLGVFRGLDLYLGSLSVYLVLHALLFVALYIIAWLVIPGGREFLKDLSRTFAKVRQPSQFRNAAIPAAE